MPGLFHLNLSANAKIEPATIFPAHLAHVVQL